MTVVFYLKMADSLRASGLDLIREYIPDSPVYNPEDKPCQYNIPYVPPSHVYPTPVYNPPSPEYTPSAITTVPELDLIDMGKEQNVHIKFLDPPASSPSSDVPSGSSHLQITSVLYTSPAANTLHTESSGPTQGMPIPVYISKGILPQLKSDTDMDEGLQQSDQPIEVDTKEEGECTDQDDQDMPPLIEESTGEAQNKNFSPDP